MRHRNNWKPIAAIAVLLPFSSPGFSKTDVVANAAPASAIGSYTSRFSDQESLSQFQPEVQFSQTSSTCYQVAVEDGMYVREQPTVYSEAIGILSPGQNVEIASSRPVSLISVLAPTENYIWTEWLMAEPLATGNWMPISAPIQGYVWADWLLPC